MREPVSEPCVRVASDLVVVTDGGGIDVGHIANEGGVGEDCVADRRQRRRPRSQQFGEQNLLTMKRR